MNMKSEHKPDPKQEYEDKCTRRRTRIQTLKKTRTGTRKRTRTQH